MDGNKEMFKLTILEKYTHTPLKLKGAVPDGYTYKSATVEITGTVGKDGNTWTFTPRGSKTVIVLKEAKDVKEGKVYTVSGKWTQEKEGENDKPSVIEVKSAKEVK